MRAVVDARGELRLVPVARRPRLGRGAAPRFSTSVVRAAEPASVASA